MAEVKNGESRGKLTQIIGAVHDIKFDEGNLPEINDAIRIPLKDGAELIVEVSQHLGDDTVRCIAMGSTTNSEIINLNRVNNFDLSFTGTICVKLSNGTVTYVSRRYVSKIKKILGM